MPTYYTGDEKIRRALDAFERHGLGQLVQSWIGTGANLPTSGEQIERVLGSQRVQELASKSGILPDKAKDTLAQILPTLIDKLTPQGRLPSDEELRKAGWGGASVR